VDLHSTTRRIGQFLDEGRSDLIAKDECLERDVRARRADRVQHGRVDLLAVHERRDAVARDQRGTQEDAERTAEVRVGARIEAARAVQQPLLGGREVCAERDHQCRDQQGDEDYGEDGHGSRLCHRPREFDPHAALGVAPGFGMR
jgi:hypothetical protein